MALTDRHPLPRVVERGVQQILTLDVYDEGSSRQSATAGTVTLYVGSRVLQAATAVSSLGPPASYTLPANVTSSEGLSDAWLEVWALTLGGVVHTFRRAGYLVRHAWHPTITDTDLTDADSDLLNLLPADVTSLRKWRERAENRIQRLLARKGRRPWLIFDPEDLTDAHVYLSLHYFYRDQALKVGDGRYKDEAAAYLKEFEGELASVAFRYDGEESGTIDDETAVGAVPTLTLSGAPRHRAVGGRGWR